MGWWPRLPKPVTEQQLAAALSRHFKSVEVATFTHGMRWLISVEEVVLGEVAWHPGRKIHLVACDLDCPAQICAQFMWVLARALPDIMPARNGLYVQPDGVVLYEEEAIQEHARLMWGEHQQPPVRQH